MGRFETIRRTRFLVITMCFISMVILPACGRTMSVADSDSDNASGNDTVYDVSSETGDAPLTTAQGILQKKARKFIKANADTSVMKDGDIKNILIVGQDRRKENKAEMRSDSMMIFSINTTTNEINLVSLMRDMYLPCADGKDGMINMTYLNGGAELLSAGADLVIGTQFRSRIVSLLNEVLATGHPLSAVEPISENMSYESLHVTGCQEHTRAVLKIQEGCGNRCSYCVIPSVRGPIRSRSLEDISAESFRLAGAGYKASCLCGMCSLS